MIIKLEELSSDLLSEIKSHHGFNKVLFPCGSLTGLYKGDYIREYEFIFHLTSTTENNILWLALGDGPGQYSNLLSLEYAWFNNLTTNERHNWIWPSSPKMNCRNPKTYWQWCTKCGNHLDNQTCACWTTGLDVHDQKVYRVDLALSDLNCDRTEPKSSWPNSGINGR